MDRRDFFQKLFGDEPRGVICIRGISRTKPVENIFVETYEEADAAIAHFEEEGRNVYFTTGALKDSTSATVANILYHRSFFLDIDCGAGKSYPTKKEGVTALMAFCNAVDLPIPTLVDSGNGVHCYWFMDTEVPYNLWKPVGVALKAKAQELGLLADPAVTGDGARILRVPGTFNTKDRLHPKPVTIKTTSDVLTYERFIKSVPPVATHATPKSKMDELTANLAGIKDIPCSFEVLLNKCFKTKQFTVREKIVSSDVEGNESISYKDKVIDACAGCPQIKYAYENRTILSPDEYNVWLYALTVAKFCTDSEKAIHTISEGHPTYSPEGVEAKAATLNAPILCESWRRLSPECADRCNGCGYWREHKKEGEKRLTTPIMLGRVAAYATPEDNILTDLVHKGSNEIVDIEVPIQYPPPWVRPKHGGIVRRNNDAWREDDDFDETSETFVFENDLWVKQIVKDPDAGEVIHLVLVQPDGPNNPKQVVEFFIPSEDVARGDKLRGTLARNGVHGAITPARGALLQQYIESWVGYLKHHKITFYSRLHYGWHEENTFVVGDKEYVPFSQPVYSPPSRATEMTASYLHSKGSLDLWRQMVNTYGTPGNEAKAFTVFAGFGAPLYKFLNRGSCTIHLTNKDSGVGKSTSQRVGASIWGDPRELMLLSTDTDNAKYHQFGVFRNLPIFVDEVTNMPADRLSDFAFRVSENRGKHRQYSHSNSIRKNDTRWETLVVTSGNNSLHETIQQHQIVVGGELNRIIEIPVVSNDSLSVVEGRYWYEEVLYQNYGLAAPIFVQYLVDNMDEVIALVKKTDAEYVEKFKIKQQHRFYCGACAAAFTAARIAKELGLHDIDVDAVERWAIRQIDVIATVSSEASEQDSVSMLGRFIDTHKRNELVVNGQKMFAGGLEISQAAMKEPFGQLMMRVESDNSSLYISQSALSHWCGENRVHFNVMLDDLEKHNMLIHRKVKKRLAEGMASPGLPVTCVCIDLKSVA